MNKSEYKQLDRACAAFGISSNEFVTLRNAARNLCRWYEQECGDSNEYASWAIERDEVTDKPYRVVYPYKGNSHRSPIRDMEKAHTAKIHAICEAHGLHYYLQTDPRGGTLYISNEPISDSAYNRAFFVA